MKNKRKLDYKQLRLDDHQYSSGEEQEEQEEKQEKQEEKQEKQEEKQEKQDKKPFNPEEIIEWMINREKLPINNELFKKHFKL